MATADKLLDQILSWIEQRERCANQLRKLARELESLKEKCNASKCVGNSVVVVGAACMIGAGVATLLTGGAAAPLLGLGAMYTGTGTAISVTTTITESFLSSDTMKEAQKIDKESNETAERIQKLSEKLKDEMKKMNPDPDELDQHILIEIMRAMARRSGLEINFNHCNDMPQYFHSGGQTFTTRSFSPDMMSLGLTMISCIALTFAMDFCRKGSKGLQQITKAMCKGAVLKGGAMVAGGVVAMTFALPEAIDNWKEMIKNNHVTKASQSLRDAADKIEEVTQVLREQLNNTEKALQEMAERQRKDKEELSRKRPRQVTPCTDHQSIARQTQTERQRLTERLTIKLMNMSLDDGRKLEYPDSIHNDTGRTCKLHTEWPSRPMDLHLKSSRCEASELTTFPLCRPTRKVLQEMAERQRTELTQREIKVISTCLRLVVTRSSKKKGTTDSQGGQTRQNRQEDRHTKESNNDRKRQQNVQWGSGSGGGGGGDREGGGNQGDRECDEDKESDGESDEESEYDESFDEATQNDPATVRIVVINVRSLNNKRRRLYDLMRENNPDIFLPTETWLNHDNANEILSEISPENYSSVHQARDGRGGGVAIMFSQAFQCKEIRFDFITIFEYVAVVLQHSEWDEPVLLINVYRQTRYRSIITFRKEFHRLLIETQKYSSIIVTGDFNIWVDDESKSSTRKFKVLLQDAGFDQHVTEQTHQRGHTLDLIITRHVEISDVNVRNDGISDHYTIYFRGRPMLTHKKKKTKAEKDQDKQLRKKEE